MREVHGISNMLSTCFALLPIMSGIVYLFSMLFNLSEFVEIPTLGQLFITIGLFILLAIVFWFRMKKNILNRIRMVMGIYEASIDKDSAV